MFVFSEGTVILDKDKFLEEGIEGSDFGVFSEKGIDVKSCYQRGSGDRYVTLRSADGSRTCPLTLLEDRMRGFDFYYFIDLKEENCTRLELKLAQYPTAGYKQFRPGDANDITRQLGAAMKRDTHLKSLVLLDPFGMNIDWSTIESITGKSVDLWILLPSGVIINRLLEKDGSLQHYETLERFFGISIESIREWFYTPMVSTNLFGETEAWYEKKDNPIQRIADLYIERLAQLFPYVTNKPLVMKNSSNVPIYHFVCASHNATAVKMAQQIIDKRQK